MKRFILIFLFNLSVSVCAAEKSSVGPACFIPVTSDHIAVRGEFSRRIDITIRNNLMRFDWDGEFLDPFRKKDWPAKVDDSHKRIGLYVGMGKVVDALVSFSVYTKDPEVIKLKDHVIGELLKTQLDDGYLGTFMPEHRLSTFWDLHETAYLIYAFVNNYRSFKHTPSLDAARKMAEYIIRNRPPKNPPHWTGKLNIERAFIALSEETADRRYLDYAVEGALPDANNLRTWRGPVEGHAYTFMNMCLAQLDLYRTERDTGLLEQSHKVVDYLTKNDGLLVDGTCSLGESFHNNQDVRGNLGEACATAYLIRLLHNLLQFEGKPLYGDMMERAVYNAMFANQSPDGCKLRYFTPMEGHREYFWLDGYCCPGNWRRILAELPEMIYYTSSKGVMINLYVSSTADISLSDGLMVRLRQETNYPNSGNVTVYVKPSRTEQFSLMLRIPKWCTRPTITVNGKSLYGASPGSLFTIERKWSKEDTVQCSFPMEVRLIRGRGMQSGRAAVMRGPVLFCLNPARQQDAGLFMSDISLKTRIMQQLFLKLAETRAKLSALKGEPISIANLISGGKSFSIDPRDGKITVGNAEMLACEVNILRPVEGPLVDCVVVPDGGADGKLPVPLTTTGIRVTGIPHTCKETWDYVRLTPCTRQATSVIDGVDYASSPHSMLTMHANKLITLDLDYVRRISGLEDMIFRSLVCYGGGEEPQAEFSVYIDGKCTTQPAALARKPITLETLISKNQRFLTLVVTDQNNSIAFDQVFFADPVLTPVSYYLVSENNTIDKVLSEEREISARVAALGGENYKPEQIIKEMILDVNSFSTPEPDSSIRPDGLKLKAKAWISEIEISKSPDLNIELTEFPDPGGEATYFRFSAGGVNDELIIR